MGEAGLSIRVSDAAKQEIADEGFDPAYGARPLKRIIQQRLANELATELLDGRIAPGGTVAIDWNGHEFTFTPVVAAEPTKP
jgi:ATP-dependent Clp protease ATP-binding subunit ClpB